MTLEIGQVIDDKYRITRLLGQGGMGAVYEASNIRISRKVAIKVLHAQVSGQAEVVARFEREAQAAGRIGSEHICEVYDLGSLADGARYIVMEFMEGETLGQRIQTVGRLKAAQVVPLMTQLLDGLGAAHEAGIIHRDLKPDNVFLLRSRSGLTDFVKILDFGVSKFSPLGDETNMGMTRVGTVVGTPYYMSPEQARGSTPVDARSDIYALGVVLYQTATGVLPHDAGTFNELLFKIVMEEPAPPQNFAPDLELDFSAIIQKAMARDPARRYQSCAEFRDALLAWGQTRDSVRPPGLGASGQRRPGEGGGTVVLPAAPGLPPASSQASSPGAPQGASAATGSSWGNASGEQAAPPATRPPSKAVPIAVALVLAGAAGLAATYFLVLRPGHPPAPVPAASAAPPGSTGTLLASAAPPAASAPAVPPSAALAPTASTAAAAPTAPVAVTPPVAGRPPAGGRPPPPRGGKPPPRGGGATPDDGI